MNIEELNNKFYQVIGNTLKSFMASEENQEVYALVFDCDSRFYYIYV